MERQNAKHGPRLDEELKKETQSLERGAPVEAHVEEHREHEPAADAEPVASSRAGAGDEITARRELSRHLRVSAFPATRDELLAEAEENNAPEAVSETLRRLPDGVKFANVHDVWAALGGTFEQVEGRPARR